MLSSRKILEGKGLIEMKICQFQKVDLSAPVAFIIFFLVAESREQAEERLGQEGFGDAEFVKELTRDQFYREYGTTLCATL